MKFSDSEINSMRTELAANAVKTMRRHLKLAYKINAYEVNDMLADATQLPPKAVSNYSKFGVPARYVDAVCKMCQQNGIKLYKHQFAPTDEICCMWLTQAYDHDIEQHHTKHLFKQWDHKLKRVTV